MNSPRPIKPAPDGQRRSVLRSVSGKGAGCAACAARDQVIAKLGRAAEELRAEVAELRRRLGRIRALLPGENGRGGRGRGQADYDDMVEILSRFRAALTADLESRRKRSIVWSIIDLRDDRKARDDLKERLGRLKS